jgi:hypothetical protein
MKSSFLFLFMLLFFAMTHFASSETQKLWSEDDDDDSNSPIERSLVDRLTSSSRFDLLPRFRTLLRVLRMINRPAAKDRLKEGMAKLLARHRGQNGGDSRLSFTVGNANRKIRMLKKMISLMSSKDSFQKER